MLFHAACPYLWAMYWAFCVWLTYRACVSDRSIRVCVCVCELPCACFAALVSFWVLSFYVLCTIPLVVEQGTPVCGAAAAVSIHHHVDSPSYPQSTPVFFALASLNVLSTSYFPVSTDSCNRRSRHTTSQALGPYIVFRIYMAHPSYIQTKPGPISGAVKLCWYR